MSNVINCYTDGSYNIELDVAGYGYLVEDKLQHIATGKGHIMGLKSSNQAELYAIHECIKYIIQTYTEPTDFIIHTDSMYSYLVLTGQNNAYANLDMIDSIRQLLDKTSFNISIRHASRDTLGVMKVDLAIRKQLKNKTYTL